MINLKISKRLMIIADLIPDNSSILDIGCDHAYLDIYLMQKRHNISCIASDIETKVLEKAKENIADVNLSNNIKVIKSDGFLDLVPKKDDIAVIAGMGTRNILKILKQDISKLPNTIIIQSNNELKNLRKKVTNLGYYIDDEKYIFDKKGYVTIKFVKGNKKYFSNDYFLGPILKNDISYLNYLLAKKEINYKNIPFYSFKSKIVQLKTIFIIKHYLSKNHTKI